MVLGIKSTLLTISSALLGDGMLGLGAGVVLVLGFAVGVDNGCNAQSASVALSPEILLVQGCDPAPPQALNKASRAPLINILYCVEKS